MMYYLYHIPGKKIGVTCDLNNRVTKQQGYNVDEYEVLLSSDDIDYISRMEIQLQKAHGYKVDKKLYKNLKPITDMKINVTEQTTTFPVPVNKLKGRLMDNIGMSWSTEHGELNITPATINWIMKNVKTSMYNNDRSYVYNKAFSRFYDNNDVFDKPVKDEIAQNRFDLIRKWAMDRGIYKEGNSHTQYVKLMEEAGELAKALLKKDDLEIIDAIGDMVVVLTNLAAIEGLQIEGCIDSAYKVISKRTGKMINGTFVKDE
jgi:NTP pyrophosphatase (non-canonical NTP hydrolase)